MPTVTKAGIARFDSLKLFASALTVVLIGVGSFALADQYHISYLALFFVWMGVGFIAKAVEDFRGLLKRPPFLLFVIAWLFIHLLVCAVSWAYLSLTEWASAVLLESILGYFSAHKIFKVPYPGDVEQNPRRDLGV
jgi:hypothetical protein